MRILVIGNGFVGKASASVRCEDIEVIIYDIDPDKCEPKNISLDESVIGTDIIFVCVPTPYDSKTNKCYLGIIETVINNLKKIDDKLLNKTVIRSTIPPDFCSKYSVAHMPEFLTEADPIGTYRSTNVWIIGMDEENSELKDNIQKLLSLSKKNGKIVSNDIKFCNTVESGLIKLGRNTFLAMKVSYFNEMFDIANAYNINYETVRSGICADPRIGNSHSVVPGPDGFRGYGGTCFPKDLNNLIATSAPLVKNNLVILPAIVERNNIDRPETAKLLDFTEGRSVVN